ncbi:DEAD/DEAH box helicase [Paratractidigestivibacter sp.]|uniref:DEAD/DEAH box helicase n=1 Tax=Paratractidigestivibacter sp. TaxID=2847316 RepID=UPI002AC98FDE|nr:DEAD/DEAH box helicase [Paratractidigestivibacter sp.]
MGVFDRYAPFIQDFIYDHEWENLRGVQVAAGEAIFGTEDHVLLTAQTASGKTEAAFFPILTEFWEDPPASVGAIYIGPTKALINDQFYRLTDLCEEAHIPVWHWHGDVSASHKAKLMKQPSGVLQLTPESLEAILMRRHSAVAKLFCDLRYVVIDEVHSLLRGDRGGQCLCLIERLSRMAGVDPRRIGLSATIGDPEAVGAFLAAGTGRKTIVPRIEEPPRTWRISMEHFYTTGPQAPESLLRTREGEEAQIIAVCEEVPAGIQKSSGITPWSPDGNEKSTQIIPLSPDEPPTDVAPTNADPGIGYIFEHTARRKCLVFTNSREEAEDVCTVLRAYCEKNHEPDRFLIHHGNLSASIRESAEELMRDDASELSIVATATLELGIDVGRLERAFQIDAPFTVSGFLQRMGRTGRRDAPPEMWFVMREDQPEARALTPETIPWKLLQGIALVQLYREEHWVEAPRLDRLPYSLLCHQTLAILASEGELTPAQLASRVLTLTFFHRVSADDFRELLRFHLERDYIEQTETGGLIVGLAGERVVNNYKFYAVFQENVEYTVRCDSQEIGTLVAPPPPGEKVAIAGHVWIVEEVDHKRHLLYVTQVKGRVPAYFGECSGDIDTHVLERMRRALEEHAPYPYLQENARARLAQARHVAANGGLARSPLVSLGGNMWCLLPWLGSYAFLALERLLKIKCAKELGLKGLDSSRPYYMTFIMAPEVDERAFYTVVAAEAEALEDPMELIYPGEVPTFEKYDELVPEKLIRKGFAEGTLDIACMKRRVAQWS